MTASLTRSTTKQAHHMRSRHAKARIFAKFCGLVTWLGTALLLVLLWQIFSDGLRWLDIDFLRSFPSRFPERAGILSALAGTLWLISLVAIIAIPVGVATAIYIEEFGGKGKLVKIIDINISNLAGVPSIVYGIIGLTLFVR